MYKHKYKLIVHTTIDDDIFIVIPELPGCIAHGDNFEHAINLINDAIDAWLDVASVLV